MKWKSPRNGGNNRSARAAQSARSKAQIGITPYASTGNRNGSPRTGKRNPTGATTHAPKEWGNTARKEEEHLTGLAKQAEVDAIREGLDDYESMYWMFEREED